MNTFKIAMFDNLTEFEPFVNENKIRKEDMVAITNDQGIYTLFYYVLR